MVVYVKLCKEEEAEDIRLRLWFQTTILSTGDCSLIASVVVLILSKTKVKDISESF